MKLESSHGESLRSLLSFNQDFLELDKSSNNSLATLRWCPMLVKVFPEMRAWRLVDMLTALVLRCWETRAETAHESQFDFVEYFAGHGNLSRE